MKPIMCGPCLDNRACEPRGAGEYFEEEDKTLAMLTSLILLKTVCFNQFGTFKLMTRKS